MPAPAQRLLGKYPGEWRKNADSLQDINPRADSSYRTFEISVPYLGRIGENIELGHTGIRVPFSGFLGIMRTPTLGASNINYAQLAEEPVRRSRWKGKKRYVFLAVAVILVIAFALVVKFAPFWEHKPEPDKGLACSVFCSGPILGACVTPCHCAAKFRFCTRARSRCSKPSAVQRLQDFCGHAFETQSRKCSGSFHEEGLEQRFSEQRGGACVRQRKL